MERIVAHVEAVALPRAHAAAVVAGLVALDEVGVDHHRARALREPIRPGDVLAPDVDAAAFVLRFIGDDLVVVDDAALAEAEMADAAAVVGGEVAADVVVGDRVIVAAGKDADSAAARGEAAVHRDAVVIDGQVVIERAAEGIVGADQARLAGADTAGEVALVGEDFAVADRQVCGKAADEDAAAGLGGAGDGERVDLRLTPAHGEVVAVRALRRVAARDQDARSFFEREVRDLVGDEADRVADEQRLDLGELLLLEREVRGRRGAVENGDGGAESLQRDRLPEDDVLLVAARVEQHDGAERRAVDRRLNAAALEPDAGAGGGVEVDRRHHACQVQGDAYGGGKPVVAASDHQLAGDAVGNSGGDGPAVGGPKHGGQG